MVAASPSVPKQQQHRRLDNIQALRGIAALMVVIAHLLWVQEQLNGKDALWAPVAHFGVVGVDLFFVISGFIMVYTTVGVRHGVQGGVQFLWKRVARIYPPYLIITAAIFVTYLLSPELINSAQGNPPDVLASFLLLPQEGSPLLIVGWTLVYELYFYLVFTVCLLLPRRAMPFLLGAWALAPILLSFFPTAGPYLGLTAGPYNYEFLFGAAVGYLVTRNIVWGARTALGTGVVVCATMLVASLVPDGFSLDDIWMRVFTVGLGFAGIVYGGIILEEAGRRAFRPFVRVGNWSYSIYLVHIPIFKVLLLVAPLVGLTGVLGVVALPLAFIAALAGGWVFYTLVERPSVRLAHKWMPFRHRSTNTGKPVNPTTTVNTARSSNHRAEPATTGRSQRPQVGVSKTDRPASARAAETQSTKNA